MANNSSGKTPASAKKVTETDAVTPVTETVETNTDSDGQTSSAELRPERFAPEPEVAVDARHPADGPASNPGTLPATARVTADGRTTRLSRAARDTTERAFTAAIRILRSHTLYEPGARIPLTRAEYEAKVARRAIRESAWDDGRPEGEAA